MIDQNPHDREKLSLEARMSLTMELFTMANGPKRVLGKVKESSFGKMVANMKAIGRTTKQMVMDV